MSGIESGETPTSGRARPPRPPRINLQPQLDQQVRTKLFVGGLNFKTTDESLRAYFLAYGHVEDAKVIMEKDNYRSTGYGFVVMGDVAAARRALRFAQQVIDGRRALVQLASDESNETRCQVMSNGNQGFAAQPMRSLIPPALTMGLGPFRQAMTPPSPRPYSPPFFGGRGGGGYGCVPRIPTPNAAMLASGMPVLLPPRFLSRLGFPEYPALTFQQFQRIAFERRAMDPGIPMPGVDYQLGLEEQRQMAWAAHEDRAVRHYHIF